MHPRLGLPPGVDHRGLVAADVVPVPDVRLGVDRLTDRAQDAQRGEVELLRDVGAPLHEGPDRRRGAVEDRHPVLLDDLPPAALVRGVRRPLVHHRRRRVGQWAVDQVGVAGHPADVGRSPEDVGLGFEVEARPVRVGDPDDVAAGGVQDALGLPGAARGVHDVERMLGREELALVLGRLPLDDLVPPDVPALGHRGVLAGPADDQDVASRRGSAPGPCRPPA